MAVQLFTLVMTGSTVTTAEPTESRYFYTAVTQINVTSLVPYFISAIEFSDDSGNNNATLTTAAPDNGYYLLFIDGVLQQSSIYTVGTAGSGVQLDNATFSILESAPITLAVTNFAPISTTTVTG